MALAQVPSVPIGEGEGGLRDPVTDGGCRLAMHCPAVHWGTAMLLAVYAMGARGCPALTGQHLLAQALCDPAVR